MTGSCSRQLHMAQKSYSRICCPILYEVITIICTISIMMFTFYHVLWLPDYTASNPEPLILIHCYKKHKYCISDSYSIILGAACDCLHCGSKVQNSSYSVVSRL